MNGAEGVCAVVPVKNLSGTKSRLAPILNPGARAGLTLYMMGRVISALIGAGVARVGVVSPDPIVLAEAEGRGAAPIRQQSVGLNPALEEARRWATDLEASALLVLPADLPLLDADDVRAVLGERTGEPSVVISPDRARTGTNALLLQPPEALAFAFGLGSFEAHLRAARERGLAVGLCERPHLAFDLDTAADLARLEETEVRRR